MIRTTIFAAFLTLSACATTDAPQPATPEPVFLSDETYQSLWNAAYNSDPEADSEIAFAVLLDRDDLSPSQRGMAYMGRGLLRGIWVRDWPQAYPQCALGDFMLAKDYPISDARMTQLKEDVEYQLSRLQYFPNAPSECASHASTAWAWLAAENG